MYLNSDIYFLRFLLITFKILGLAPFSMNIYENRTHVTIEFSRSIIGLIYNVLLSLVFMLSSYIATINVLNNQHPNDTDIEIGFRLVSICCSNIFLGIISMNYSIRQNALTLLINRVIRLDIILAAQLHNQHFRCRKYVSIWIFVTNAFLHIVTRYLLVCLSHIEIVFVIGPALSSFGLASSIIQYSLVLIFLENRFHGLNESLLSLANPEDHNTELRTDIIYITSATHTNAVAMKNLHIIRNALRTLFEVSENFSDFCGCPILLSIAISCVNLIFNTYTCMLHMISKSLVADEIIFIIDQIVAISTNIFPIIILTYYGMSIAAETERTGKIVHKVMSTYPSHMAKMKYELEELSIELLHHKVSFTAGGLFPIDGSLILTIISTTITYMIILVQHNQSNS